MVIFTERKCGAIHDLESHVQCLHIAQLLKFAGMRVLFGIIVVDTIHRCCFEQHLRVQFNGSQCGCSVGSEEWISTPCCQNHHTPFLQVTLCPTTDKWLSHRWHFYCSLHPRDHVQFLHGILQDQRVHYRCKHPNIVSCSSIYASGSRIGSTPYVAATDYDCNLYSQIVYALDLCGNAPHSLSINAETFRT